jgi:hypothetical protein
MVRRVLAVLGLTIVAALPLGATATAQTADEQLAGYVGMAAGAAFSFQPIFPGLLPTGDAPFEVTGALSTANVKSGGNAFALAAAGWPGSAAANLGPLIGTAASQPLFTQVVPPFPGVVQSNQDEGDKVTGAEPGPVLAASAKPGSSTGRAQPGGGGVPGAFTFEDVSSISRSFIENGKLITESIVTVKGLAFGGGAFTIDSVKSTARAITDGVKATTEGGTVVTGAKSGGQGGEVGPDGVSGLNAIGRQVLEASGMKVTVAEPQGKAEGGAADRVSNGVTIEMPNPLASANPQFVGSKFVITIAPTAVGALASPPFDVESFSDVPIDGVATGGFSSIAGTFGDVFAAPAEASVSGGGGSSPGSEDVGSPVAFEETKNVLAHDGGVTGGLVLASGGFMLFAGRWVKKYVAQFVATQDGGA